MSLHTKTDLETIHRLKMERHSEIFSFPDKFVDALPELPVTKRHTISEPVEIDGIGSFSNQPLRIRLSPCADGRPYMAHNGTQLPLDVNHVTTGLHNIQLGEIKIIEHPLALMHALRLDVNIELTVPDFPTFDECDGPYLDAVRTRLQPVDSVPVITVAHPVAVRFERGYFIMEPDQGNQELWIDHQITYPGKSIGTRRIQLALTPDRFAFLCRARTPSFRSTEETAQIYQLARQKAIADYPITDQNVLFVDPDQIHNPRARYDHEGFNYEFLLHEVIDIIAWIKLVEVYYGGNFVGRLTTHFFGHPEQVEAARLFCSRPELIVTVA